MTNKIFDGVSVNSSFGAFKMTGPFPLNINTVKISLEELTNYIKNNDTAYPGMLIAVDDDKTAENFNVKDPKEKGIYYITQENNVLKQYKLAFQKDLADINTNLNSTISNSVEPIVQILNIMLANDCPWDEIYDNPGHQTGPNPVVSINEIQNQAINRRIYRIEPIYKESND